MSYVVAAPETLAAASADLEGVRSALSAQAAGTRVLPNRADALSVFFHQTASVKGRLS